MTQVPIIPDKIEINEILENLITTEIFRLIKEERMDGSLLSRVVTITARRFEFAQTTYLTLRFNILNGQPLQFAYRIGTDEEKLTITRDKDSDNQGILA